MKIVTKFKEIIKAMITKFSAINYVQFFAVITLILNELAAKNLVSPAYLMIATGIATILFKFCDSTKEMVSTGFSFDPMIYFMGIGATALGVFDMFATNYDVVSVISFDHPQLFLICYVILTAFIRTGFTNQTAKSKLAA